MRRRLLVACGVVAILAAGCGEVEPEELSVGQGEDNTEAHAEQLDDGPSEEPGESERGAAPGLDKSSMDSRLAQLASIPDATDVLAAVGDPSGDGLWLWLSDFAQSYIARIDGAGSITKWPIGSTQDDGLQYSLANGFGIAGGVVWAAIRDTIVHVSLASGDVNKFKISDLADIGFADDLAALRPAQLGDAVFVNDMAVGPDGSAVISLNGAAQLILLTPQGAATTLPLPTGFQAGSVAVDRNGHLAALLQPVDAAAGARLIVADAADPARTARVTEPMAAVTVASRPEGGFLTGGYEARQRVDEAGNVQEGGVREVLYNVDAGMHRVGDSIVVVERDGLAVYPNEDAFLGGDEPARELISFGTFDCSANRPELAVPAPRPEDDRGDGPSRCPTTAMWVAVDGQNNLWTAHSGEPGLVYRLDGQRLP